jgi:hypothetical protein
MWNEMQIACIEIIRETNPTRKIIVNGADWGGASSIPRMVLPHDENLIADFHFYDPFQFTHQGAEWVGDPNHMSWIGTEWHGTNDEVHLLEQTFIKMKTWSEATNVPVMMGEFGAFSPADMDSRARWTAAVRLLAEEYGFAWSYWELASGFGIYDPDEKKLREPLVNALLGEPFPENYGMKTGGLRMIVHEDDEFFGPSRLDIAVEVNVDSWTGISTEISEEGTMILTLNGPDTVPDWANFYIPLDITDTGSGFSHDTAILTVRNIDDSITDFGFALEMGAWGTPGHHEAFLLRLMNNDLIRGNGQTAIKNADGTLSIHLNLKSAYNSFKGKDFNSLNLKMFLESLEAVEGQSRYDRLGSVEFISLELK